MAHKTTEEQYKSIIDDCRNIFLKKTADYGTSWRVYRPISVADQLYIKAKRIRNIQDGSVPKVADDINDEFRGIINYSVIGLMQLMIESDNWDVPIEEVKKLYEKVIATAIDLLYKKNHDYGEAWRDMDVVSITDLILAKVLRIRQIVRNEGRTMISEGIDSNYYDILNYAVFALILSEGVINQNDQL